MHIKGTETGAWSVTHNNMAVPASHSNSSAFSCKLNSFSWLLGKLNTIISLKLAYIIHTTHIYERSTSVNLFTIPTYLKASIHLDNVLVSRKSISRPLLNGMEEASMTLSVMHEMLNLIPLGKALGNDMNPFIDLLCTLFILKASKFKF